MTELKIEHVLLLAVAAFLMYHLLGGCGFNRGDGFNVGGQSCSCNYIKNGECTQIQSGETFDESLCNKMKSEDDCINQYFGNARGLEICSWDSGVDKVNQKLDTLTSYVDTLLCQLINSEKCIDPTKIGKCNNLPN